MDRDPSNEIPKDDIGKLKARFILDDDRERVSIRFRCDPDDSRMFHEILSGEYEVLSDGDKVLRTARYEGGGYIDTLNGSADFSGTGNLITITDATDDLLLELLDALPDKKKTVKYYFELAKYDKEMSCILPQELQRLKKMSEQKSLW